MSDEAICPIHKVIMTGKDGKFGHFFSHKLPDNTWCNGKEKDQTSSTKPGIKPSFTVNPKVWEEKDRMYMSQTCLNAAAAVFQGTGEVEKVKEAWKEFYNLLRNAKKGIVQNQIPEDGSSEQEIDVNELPF